MNVEQLTLGQLGTATYIISENGEALVIDPADEAEFIADKIYRAGLKLKGILATHGHFDHVLAAGMLQMILPAPFYINQRDDFLLKQMNENAEFWLREKFTNPLPAEIIFIKDGYAIKIGSAELKTIETPGHTPGSVCFFAVEKNSGRNLLFSGDTLFAGGIGRYDFSYSDKKELFNSLKKITALPEETIVYCGHGEPTLIVSEKNALFL